jgi:hypothetical protein
VKAVSLRARIGLGALAALVVWELLTTLVAPLGGGGSGGRTSSSYSTKAAGLGAYADLLAQAGHRVTRARRALDHTGLSPDATLVVADLDLGGAETAAAEEFVRAGGRLVLAGRATSGAARAVVDSRLTWQPQGVQTAVPFVPVPETSGVEHVLTDSPTIADTGPALPFLGQGDRTLAAAAVVGQGRVMVLADALPLQNQTLAAADNAAFGLALAGPVERPVVFAEAGRRGGDGTGLGALPTRWKWALAAGGIATLLAMWSAGRRFGPPEDEGRELPPARRAYVDALAATLVKAKQPDAAMAPLRAAARERLRRRAALAPDATDEQLRRAAVEVGLAPDEVAALFGAVTGDEQALAVGRAMARLGGM